VLGAVEVECATAEEQREQRERDAGARGVDQPLGRTNSANGASTAASSARRSRRGVTDVRRKSGDSEA
jgi:hypothetical protein